MEKNEFCPMLASRTAVRDRRYVYVSKSVVVIVMTDS